jgi:hypothetical protein
LEEGKKIVSSQAKKIIWLLWILIFPAGSMLTYHFYPPDFSGQGISLFAFFILMFFVSSMPMVINNTPIFLIQWVTMAVFLTFGLFAEMIMVQLGILVLLLRLKIQKDQLFRLPLNSLLFFTLSLLSGLAYFAMGGKIGVDLIENPQYFWIAAAYFKSGINQCNSGCIVWQENILSGKRPYMGNCYLSHNIPDWPYPLHFIF